MAKFSDLPAGWMKILFDTGTRVCLFTLWQLVWYWDHTTGFVLSRKIYPNEMPFEFLPNSLMQMVQWLSMMSHLHRWLSNNLEWRVLLLNCNRYLSVGCDFALEENYTHLRFYVDFRTDRFYLQIYEVHQKNVDWMPTNSKLTAFLVKCFLFCDVYLLIIKKLNGTYITPCTVSKESSDV